MNTTTLALGGLGLYMLLKGQKSTAGTPQVSFENLEEASFDEPIQSSTALDLYKVRDSAPLGSYWAVNGFRWPTQHKAHSGAGISTPSAIGVLSLPASVRKSLESVVKAYQMRDISVSALKTSDKDPSEVEVWIYVYDGIDNSKTNMISLGNGIYIRSFHRKDVVTGSSSGSGVSVSSDGVEASYGGVSVGFKF